MKNTQLMLNFGKSVLRHLRLLPDAADAPSAPRHSNGTRDAILEKLSRRLLREVGCRSLDLTVRWNPRLRTTAGLACWRTKTISLNPKLVEVSPAEVQRTLRHELAHFLAQHRVGRRRIAAHGPEWREACRDLGIPRENRCHDLPFKRARQERKHFYACRECGTTLARVRPVKRRVACLKCCRRHNGGHYDERFRFVQTDPPERLAA
jgi:predicted SprT family Zn-dependent metalloprotease